MYFLVIKKKNPLLLNLSSEFVINLNHHLLT